LKIRGDIRNSRCTTGINDTGGANFSTSFASVVDTGGKFATGVAYSGGKQWEQLSNCCQLKMNLKKKYIYMLLYYPKVSKRNLKNFSY
jgi:hypothetical protein